jgi:zinc protease
MRTAALLGLCLAVPCLLSGQPEGAAGGDTAVLRGTLENGLAYYVRANAEPPGRAELRLVVNVGSVLEDDDQRGLAHFLEHMAFNGTRRFQKQEIVGYLEGIGMRFGPDVNAYTGFDETVYLLQLPVDSVGVLERGLEILADWAGGITLDSLEVEQERGVVIEEWRRRLGAGSRLADRQVPFLFAGSRYAERMPIGDPTILATFPHEALRRFHARWYRPELMAVVAVGDFEAAAVVERIRAEFGGIPASAVPVRRPVHDVPAHDSTRFLVTVDAEVPRAQVSVNWLMPTSRDTSLARARTAIVQGMFTGMLGERLNEITLRPDAPFLDVGSYQGGSLRTLETLVLSAAVAEGGAERGLAALESELARAARHGFTAGELEREKSRLLRAWEQIHAERGNTTSAAFAGQYVEHFLRGGALRTVDEEYRRHLAIVPTVTLAEVDAAARRYAEHADRAVLVSGPSRAELPVPTARRLAFVSDSARAADPGGYDEALSGAPLLGSVPEPGRVVAEEAVPEAGVVRWTLSNGARVVLRPTDFRDDEILFAASSPGGLSLLPDSLLLYGRTATAAVQLGGVGELSLTDLQRRLTGKAASVGTFVSELGEGMNGFAAPADVETLFQLAHLYFTEPRRDSTAWEAYRQRGREGLRNRDVSPESAFADTLTAILTQGHARTRPFTAASFDSLSLDRSLGIYRERFAGAGDFTFYFVGRFEPESLRPLVERYLASLPAGGREEAWRDAGVRPPRGIVRRTVRRGVEPRARSVLVFTGPVAFSREAVSDAGSLADALEIRLRERLREELGGTYGVSVSGSVARDPYPRFSFAIDFGSAPERVDELLAAVWEEIAAARAQGLPEEVAARVREAHRRRKEIVLRDNSAWLGALIEYDRLGWDIRTFPDPPLSAGLTPERLRDAALRYLDPGRYVLVTLLPEER